MMIEITEKEKCCGCAACKNICPKNCISMQVDDEGFSYPQVDISMCVDCSKCTSVCPIINNPNKDAAANLEFYAGRAIEADVRQKSSSGGMAYLLAKKFMLEHQVVCGVRMSDDFSYAEHVCIDNIEDINQLRGSKYIQSNTEFIYKAIGECVEKKKRVLFIGTPCQVAAVKNYFRKYDEYIFYIDIICHGVPSQLLWDKYRTYVSKKYRGNIKTLNFRDKNVGWEEYGLSAEFDNGKHIYVDRKRGFLGLFLKNICLRPVCGKCRHKGFNRCSDLTLGDFWGIERVLPEYDKKNGVSLIMVNTERGKELLSSLESEIEIKSVDCKDLFQFRNKSLIRSVNISPKRDEFLQDLKVLSFSALENKYLGNRLIFAMKKLIKRIMKL